MIPAYVLVQLLLEVDERLKAVLGEGHTTKHSTNHIGSHCLRLRGERARRVTVGVLIKGKTRVKRMRSEAEEENRGGKSEILHVPSRGSVEEMMS